MVKLISVTPDAEKIIAYCARVSSSNQDNPDIEKLIKYCIQHGHWSIFEQAHMTVEIETSRMISAQILRHKSFNFQEFSQRYSEAQDYVEVEARRQDMTNRQNSIDDLDPALKSEWMLYQHEHFQSSMHLYKWAIDKGIAKECARAVLPMQTKTRLYMTGSVRSWIHYLLIRTDFDTQLEHRNIALEIRFIFCGLFPVVSRSLGWLV